MKQKKTIHFKILTKGEITASALEELRYRGFDCWPENNLAVRGRKFTGRPGKPDIIGFGRYTGCFIGCEVKTISDTFSGDQINFLNDLASCNGSPYVAYQNKQGQLKIETWHEYQSTQIQSKPNGSKKTSNNTETKK